MTAEYRLPPKIYTGQTLNSTLRFLWYSYDQHTKRIADPKNPEYQCYDVAERYACGFPLPDFQRDLCWTRDQEVAFIETLWAGLPPGIFIIHATRGDSSMPNGITRFSGWCLEGQQRLTTIQRYFDDVFSVHGLYFSELNKLERSEFMTMLRPSGLKRPLLCWAAWKMNRAVTAALR